MPITLSYAVVGAKYVEYLSPGNARPGADPATGSVTVNFDCTKASEVFKIRAFNEFSGSDAKDPSPYVSVTVVRKGGASSSSSSSSSPSSTTSTKAPAPPTT